MVKRYNVVHQDSMTCARLLEALEGPMVTYSDHAAALRAKDEECCKYLRLYGVAMEDLGLAREQRNDAQAELARAQEDLRDLRSELEDARQAARAEAHLAAEARAMERSARDDSAKSREGYEQMMAERNSTQGELEQAQVELARAREALGVIAEKGCVRGESDTPCRNDAWPPGYMWCAPCIAKAALGEGG